MAGSGVSGGAPVRLTIVSYGPGAARITAGRKHQAGLLPGEFFGATACLRPVAGERPASPREAEQARFALFRDARAGLRERLAERGPWWAA